MSINKFLEYYIRDDIVNRVIPSVFPSLNASHTNLLAKYLIVLLHFISVCFGITHDEFIKQIRKNNFQDMRWLLTFLLPYLNESNNHLITSLEQIYNAKKTNTNINKSEPEYLHSNIQYNRCVRNIDDIQERNFNLVDIESNYYLLLDTIKTSSNKLCPNWINIFPLRLEDYKNTQIYKNTKKIYDSNNLFILDVGNEFNINTDQTILYMRINEFGKYLDIGDIYNTISIDLFDRIKNIKWVIFDIIVNGNQLLPGIIIFDKILLLDDAINNIEWDDVMLNKQIDFEDRWKKLLLVADSQHQYITSDINIENNNLRSFIKGFIMSFDRYVGGNKKLSDDIEYVRISKDNKNISYPNISQTAQSISIKYIYKYFKDILQQFKTTWYGTKMLTYDKKKFESYQPYDTEQQIKFTYKNVYNFAKNLVHYNDGKKYTQYPTYWKSLTDIQQTIILNRLNNKENWFRITKNISNLKLDKKYGMSINEINNQIYNNIRVHLIDIVFGVMITKGIMTTFKPNNELDVFDAYNNTHYWLTDLPYKQTPHYFKFARKKKWYTVKSYDWIAQLGFCHHFINNRITYITGATGVGKSTFVPTLYLYYLKALDWIQGGKLVCSQPRRAPVELNAEYVSKIVGVPIKDDEKYDSDDIENTKTDNFYIQYKHQENQHEIQTNHMYLKYITDGTLILQVKDPILKIKNSSDKYTSINEYDIIMIDEAHEHKIHMDLLLSVLKLSLSYNNSLRLVILSATMDEDEPRYRRFYRDINDNKKYPCNEWIKKYDIDRINTDRRFHISPPGESTRFTVTDIYVPHMRDKIEELILDIVKNKLKSGEDVLVFQPGEQEIKKLIKKINPLLPNHTIALPYYGTLDKTKRSLIEKIDEQRVNLRVSKDQDFYDKNVDHTSGTNKYTNIIIIATNVAEASITIGSLKFVIETGTRKEQIYDYKKRSSSLILQPISESSRIQRRGRVGRKSSGTVYYLYEKDEMAQNRIQYEIAINDLYLDLFRFLKEDATEQILIDSAHNISSPQTILSDTQYYETSGIDRMIIKQYFNDKQYYNYFGSDSFYDYKNYIQPVKYYQTGYDYQTLTDQMGNFYLIHPNELDLKRNIRGDIVGTISDECKFTKVSKHIGKIESQKMKAFWQKLLDYMYVSVSQPIQTTLDYTKTDIGNNIIRMSEDLQARSHELFRMLVFGIGLRIGEQIFRLYIMITTLGLKLENLSQNILIDGKSRFLFDKIILTKNFQSDSEALLDILNNFHNYLSKIGISDNLQSSNYVSELEQTDKFKIDDYKELLGYSSVYTEKFRKKTTTERISKLETEVINKAYNVFVNKINPTDITDWCGLYGISEKIIVSYISTYMRYKIKFWKKFTSTKYADFFINLRKNMSQITSDKLTVSVLLGFPHNICKKTYQTNYYLSIYTPNLLNTYQIASITPFRYVPITLVKPDYLQKYVLYMNSENDQIQIIHYITPKIFKIMYGIYNNFHFNNFYPKKDEIMYFKKIPENKKLTSNLLLHYTQTLADIRSECINKSGKEYYSFIHTIVPSHKYYLDNIDRKIDFL